MDEWGYDVVVTASQKAFAAPPGVAMIAASERAWKKIESIRRRASTSICDARSKPGSTARRRGRRPISILFALDVALERYHEQGMEAQLERHARYARAVRRIASKRLASRSSRARARTPIRSWRRIRPKASNQRRLLERLRERYGVVLSGGQAEFAGKIVRFGTMGDVTEADLLGAIGAIELGLADLGAAANPGAGTAAAIESLGARVRVGA